MILKCASLACKLGSVATSVIVLQPHFAPASALSLPTDSFDSATAGRLRPMLN